MSAPRRRLGRRLLIAGTLIVGLAGLLFVVATRSPLTTALVMRAISASAGGMATARSVVLDPDGTVEIAHLVIEAAGVTGAAGRVVEIERLRAQLDMGALSRGTVQVKSVELVGPVLRISQSLDDGSLNLAAMVGSKQAGRSGEMEFPRISVERGAIELAEHRNSGEYVALQQFDVSGLLEQQAEVSGGSKISFRQIDASGQPTGLLEVHGQVSKTGISVSIGDLDLRKIDPSSLPTPFRDGVQRLALSGLIRGTEFEYGFDGEFRAGAQLEKIAVTLPLEATIPEDENSNKLPQDPAYIGRFMRVHAITGKVRLAKGEWSGTLQGQAEELPCTVDFRWQVADPEGAFSIKLTVEDFRLGVKPDVVRFAPPVAMLRFNDFGDPTGLVDAEVVVERGPPQGGQAAPTKTKGWVNIEDGSAAFHKFPYRFYELKGRFEFDDDMIRIVNVKGVAPGGASLTCNAEIAPPANPAMDLRVHVDNLPTDDTLTRAMLGRARILDELFSKRAYAELIQSGLIRAPGTPGDAPEFAMGGIGTLDVQVLREPVLDDPKGPGKWTDIVTVHFDEVGTLPDKFPFPMVAHNVTIVKRNNDATVSGGLYHGLEGGEAIIETKADLGLLADPEAKFVPTLTVAARKVPLSPLLMQALPKGGSSLEPGQTIPEIVGRFGLIGDLNAQVTLSMDQAGEPIYTADLRFDEVDAVPVTNQGDGQPAEWVPGAMLRDMTGRLLVDQDHLETEFSANVLQTDDRPEALPRVPAGDLRFKANFTFSSGSEPSTFDLVADAAGIKLNTPLEDFVRIISPPAADAIVQARETYQPAGEADAKVTLSGRAADPMLDAITTRFKGTCELYGERVAIDTQRGSARLLRQSGSNQYFFEDFGVALSQPQGVSSGMWTLAGQLGDGSEHAPLRIQATQARFEEPLLKAVATEVAPEVASVLQTRSPTGLFSLDLIRQEGILSGTLRPESLSIALDTVRAQFPEVRGEVRFQPSDIEIVALKLLSPEIKVRVDGRIVSDAAGSQQAALQASLSAASLTPELRSFLPDEAKDLLTDLKLEVNGSIDISGATIGWSVPPGGERDLQLHLPIRVTGTQADVGATVGQLDGVATLDLWRKGGSPTAFTLNLAADRAHVSGLWIQPLAVSVRSGDPASHPGEVFITDVNGDVHGGKLSGKAWLSSPNSESRRKFEADFLIADVRFASMLADFEALGKDPLAQENMPDRGKLDGNITLTGIAGDVASRRGRGMILVGDGRVLSMPLMVALIRVSNLQLPINEKINRAEVEFFVDGPTINIEQCAIESASVGLYGFGTASWPDLELDMRFRSRSRARIPVVSSVLEGIRGEIVTAVVKGTASQPDVSVTTLVGTTRLIGKLLGRDSSEQEKRLQQIEESGNRR